MTEILGIGIEIVDLENPMGDPALLDGVDDDRIVEGHIVETYYCPIKGLVEAEGYLRVVGDNDFTDVEIRIPYSVLKELGWVKK